MLPMLLMVLLLFPVVISSSVVNSPLFDCRRSGQDCDSTNGDCDTNTGVCKCTPTSFDSYDCKYKTLSTADCTTTCGPGTFCGEDIAQDKKCRCLKDYYKTSVDSSNNDVCEKKYELDCSTNDYTVTFRESGLVGKVFILPESLDDLDTKLQKCQLTETSPTFKKTIQYEDCYTKKTTDLSTTTTTYSLDLDINYETAVLTSYIIKMSCEGSTANTNIEDPKYISLDEYDLPERQYVTTTFYNKDGYQPLEGPLRLGMEVYLKFELIKSGDPYTAFQVVKCTAEGEKDVDGTEPPSHTFLTEQCPASGSGVYFWLLPTSNNPADGTDDSPTIYFGWESFQLYPITSKFVVKCELKLCTDTNEDSCDRNMCSSRRRRVAQNSLMNDTSTKYIFTTTVIDFVDEEIDADDNSIGLWLIAVFVIVSCAAAALLAVFIVFIKFVISRKRQAKAERTGDATLDTPQHVHTVA